MPFLFRSPINIPQDNFDNQNQDPNPFQLFPTSEPTVTNNNEQQQQSEMTAVCPGEIGFFNMNNQPQPHPQPQPRSASASASEISLSLSLSQLVSEEMSTNKGVMLRLLN